MKNKTKIALITLFTILILLILTNYFLVIYKITTNF